MYAVLGGSGLSQLPGFEITMRKVQRTPYGEPSGALTIGILAGHEIVFRTPWLRAHHRSASNQLQSQYLGFVPVEY